MTEKKLKYIKGVGWRYETEHNQKRRYIGHRYNDVGTYLVTIVVEGRKPVFGSVAGDIKAHPTAPNYPATVLSPLGERVLNEELPKIHSIYPMVEVWPPVCIMPDLSISSSALTASCRPRNTLASSWEPSREE